MKISFFSSLLVGLGAAMTLTACQSAPHSRPRQNFDAATRQTYNPQSQSFEQEPPYGRQSNKSGTIPGS